MAAILYTSGSTGRPKGVVVSHRNMVSGAASVASYIDNRADDCLLAVLPLSFDAGFSQLTTAFHAGAGVVLLDYVLPSEVIRTMARERVTGLTAVPPLWIQLAEVEWPQSIREHLRYFANTGGKMPREVLARLRAHVPAARPFLMYGLTEAFRSTYLPPEQIDQRPDSMGKAIPNQEVMVLRPDGTPCSPNEPGELVHRGSTVSLGYWGDPEQTAARFRPLPCAQRKLPLPEMVVFSGDTVRKDDEGYMYFIGRTDEMIKSSGYRISPTEVEDAVYASGLAAEVAAVGLPDARLGQAVAVVLLPIQGGDFSVAGLLRILEKSVPGYMLPRRVEVRKDSLPRNCNGKIDRKRLAQELQESSPMSAVR
jgi:acyl-CoA ligase (AMP-forming) (exosortase A-associated)